jgi:hypothetical protein
MASPQRKFPAEAEIPPASPPQLHKAPPAPQKPAAPRRWRYGYAWILLSLILGIWYVGFGWGNSGGWIWGHRNTAVPVLNDGEPSGPGVAILEVANKQDYIGQSFQVSDVSVDHWSGTRAVWIGSRHSYLPMLLILSSASPLAPHLAGAASPVNSGVAPTAGGATVRVQRLDVTGKIMKAPPTAQAQQRWNLSDEDVDQLEEEGVYIQAMTVQPAKR